MTVIRIPPPLPSKKKAVAGGTSPSLASVTVMGRSRARADNPRHVANVKGMQNLHSQRVSGLVRGLLTKLNSQRVSHMEVSYSVENVPKTQHSANVPAYITATSPVSCSLSFEH